MKKSEHREGRERAGTAPTDVGPLTARMDIREEMLGSFYRKSIFITVLLSAVLFFTIPLVNWFVEIKSYEEQSIQIINAFIEKELGENPWQVLENRPTAEDLSRKVDLLMQMSGLVDFKVWKKDGTIMYSYFEPGMAGVVFPRSEDLERAISTGTAVIGVENPSEEDESSHMAEYEKLFEIYVPIRQGGQVIGAIEIYRIPPPYRFFGSHVILLGAVSVSLFILLYLLMFGSFRKASEEIISYDRRLSEAYYLLGVSYFDTVSSLIKALELRDMETEGHSERVVALSMMIGERLDLSAGEKKKLLLGAYLHDIGKIGVPDNILLKPGRLNDHERREMNTHVEKGFNIIKDAEVLQPAVDVILSHHEKWDGTGYPKGLSGEAIPVTARIFAIVDVFDALRNQRPYKSGLSFRETKEIILSERGKHFDPAVVDAFDSFSEDDIGEISDQDSGIKINGLIRQYIQSIRT